MQFHPRNKQVGRSIHLVYNNSKITNLLGFHRWKTCRKHKVMETVTVSDIDVEFL